MPFSSIYQLKKIVARFFLLALPTAVLVFFMLYYGNQYLALFHNDWIRQGIYFSIGLVGALFFYGFRFRFATTTAVLLLLAYMVYTTLNRVSIGEFDAFYLSVQFYIFSGLFFLGWLTGYGFSRWRLYTVFWSVFLLAGQIFLISTGKAYPGHSLLLVYLPVIVYSFYIIYVSELLRNMPKEEPGFSRYLFRKIAGFCALLLVMTGLLFFAFRSRFQALEKELASASFNNNAGDNSMTRKNRDGSMSNNDRMKLSGSLNKGKNLVFVAHLDNFLPDGITPNPLYFTAFYYTRFDTASQTFEIDSLMPSNDLFQPDPSRIPLYFAQTDSSIIKNSKATLDREVVTADVYKAALSPNDYVAPSTAFFCQPLPVPREYRDQYKSAYRAKMWVSRLNSAYFIYNPVGNSQLADFQQYRYSLLRNAGDYSREDPAFIRYYTRMPQTPDYGRVAALAHQIADGHSATIDKILAIRNYFLQKDAQGNPLFSYSDNPGIPGLPNASKLNFFLFENRKGYCAYFAGATLFLLRALGIPSRVTTGFLTIDRSGKNPGWYWFYEDQAHAWVQVYFPGYGWIDFDTTVPDENTQQAPQPDGTPPLGMQQAYFVADGNILSVDAAAKKIVMQVRQLMVQDKSFTVKPPRDITADISLATISADTGTVAVADLKKGMHITAASSAEQLKKLVVQPGDNAQKLLAETPNPAPVDEVKIISPDEAKPKLQEGAEAASGDNGLWQLFHALFWVVAAAMALGIALPWFIWLWYNFRAKRSVYYKYRASLFLLNQLGYPRDEKGPAQFAREIDAQFRTDFLDFSNLYQKSKYSGDALTTAEKKAASAFYPLFVRKVKNAFTWKQRLGRFLDINAAIAFFSKPSD